MVVDYTREQLRQTQQLIDGEPTQLVLKRNPPAIKTAAGGRVAAPDPVDLEPQTVFFGAKSRDDLPLQDTQGERVIQYYVVVGMPDLDIQNGDTFMVNGMDFTVTFVHRNLAYEIKADVETYSGGR